MAELKFTDTVIFRICSWISAYLIALLFALRVASLFSLSSTVILIISILVFAVIYISTRIKRKNAGSIFKKDLFLTVFWGIVSTFSIQLFIDSEKSFIWLMLFVLISLFLSYVFGRLLTSRKTLIYSSIIGFLFALSELIGYLFEKHGGFLKLELHSGLVSLFLEFIGLGVFITVLLIFLFSELTNRSFISKYKSKFLTCNKFLRLIILATILFICWLIYYIAFYPGLLSNDSVLELDQQLGNSPISNHHPIIHQLFIRLGLVLGSGSVTEGVAAHSLLQMGIMALSFSAGINFLIKKRIPKTILIMVTCFYAFNPVIGLYSITMWKDILFGGITLLLIISLIQLSDRSSIPVTPAALIVVYSFLFCTLRNNGYYAFILGFPLYIIINRNKWKKLAVIFAAVLCLVSVYKFVIFDVAHVRESESAEALSVPIQQVARVVKTYGIDDSDKNLAVLKGVFPEIEKLGDQYLGDRVDSIKNTSAFLSEEFSKNPVKYVKAWFRLGLKYPVTYLEAFLNESYGYYYTDVDYWVATAGECPNNYGISFNPKYEKLRDGLTQLFNDLIFEKPIAILSSAGLAAWICAVSAVLLVLKGHVKAASPMIIIGMYWLTVLAGPVYCEFRYIFSIYITMPLLAGLAISIPANDSERIGSL